MKKNVNNRIFWLDIIKILACIFVLTNHTIGYIFTYTNMNNYNTLYYAINFAICKLGVPLFIMTTGSLLLKKDISYKTITKKSIRIVIVLLLISIYIYLASNKVSDYNIIVFLKSFISNPLSFPLWYLYMLIGLYIVSPFVKKMTKNFSDKDYKIFIVLFLIIPSFLPILQNLIDVSFNNYFTYSFFPISIGYLVSGYYLSNIKLNKKTKNIFIILFILPIIYFILDMYLPFIFNKQISYSLDSWYFITNSLPAIALFYLVRYLFENKNINLYVEKIVNNISLVTFGIYLSHFLIVHRIYNLSIVQAVLSINVYLGIIFFQILTFILCGLATYILRKIPLVKKIL